MSRIIIVDEFDTEIGLKERSEITPADIYRVSALWLTNSSGEVLIARRSFEKAKNPGKWSCAAAGHVDEGETYELNIIKEAKEELGLTLTPSDLSLIAKAKFKGINSYWATWYSAIKDVPIEEFTLQKEEVIDVRWISMDEIRTLLQNNQEMFTSGFIDWMKSLEGNTA